MSSQNIEQEEDQNKDDTQINNTFKKEVSKIQQQLEQQNLDTKRNEGESIPNEYLYQILKIYQFLDQYKYVLDLNIQLDDPYVLYIAIKHYKNGENYDFLDRVFAQIVQQILVHFSQTQFSKLFKSKKFESNYPLIAFMANFQEFFDYRDQKNKTKNYRNIVYLDSLYQNCWKDIAKQLISIPEIANLVFLDKEEENQYTPQIDFIYLNTGKKIKFLLDILSLGQMLPHVQNYFRKTSKVQKPERPDNVYTYINSNSEDIVQMESEDVQELSEQLLYENQIFKEKSNVKVLGKDKSHNSYIIFKNIQNCVFVCNQDEDLCFQVQGLQNVEVMLDKLKKQGYVNHLNSEKLVKNIQLCINQQFFGKNVIEQVLDYNKVLETLRKQNFYLEGLDMTELENLIFDEDTGYRIKAGFQQAKDILVLAIKQYSQFLQDTKSARYANFEKRKNDLNSVKQAECCQEIGEILVDLLEKFQKVEKLYKMEDQYDEQSNNNKRELDFEDLEKMYQKNSYTVKMSKTHIKLFKNYPDQAKTSLRYLIDELRDGSENFITFYVLSIGFNAIISQYIQQQQIKQHKLIKKQRVDDSFSDMDGKGDQNSENNFMEDIEEADEIGKGQDMDSEPLQPIMLDTFVFQKSEKKSEKQGQKQQYSFNKSIWK